MEEVALSGDLPEVALSGELPELAEALQVTIDDEEDDDFEFAFSVDSDSGAFSDVSADEIFFNGRILPVYPLFNRDLIYGCETPSIDEEKLALEFEIGDLHLESESPSSSMSPGEEEVERHRRAASENMIWVSKSTPESPNRCRKSSSTGSSSSGSRKWKLRDLVVGRSRSDGNARIVPQSLVKEKKILRSLYSIAKSSEGEKKEKSRKGKGEAVKEMDVVTAHRIYYGKVGSGVGKPAAATTPAAAGGSRRSYLPYRQELIGGIFGNPRNHLF